jgi:type I restriction enzyme S subunit
MIANLKPYPAYQDSGVPLLGEIPAHWEALRLRDIVQLLVSNVDKHTIEGEIPVQLCNYVDVYKNEVITNRLPFMRATATEEEIRRFRLRVGDVVITKDSEAWDDIGVPALIAHEAPDFVCGYHIAILRPKDHTVSGRFLLRCLQSKHVAAQFFVAANGITRYGLSHQAIKNVRVAVPPLPEQADIARFLDYINRRTRRYIRAKRRLVALLEEQKQAIIQRTVTHGLDAEVQLKPSGMKWLGDVPKHWEIKRAKYYLREVNERSATGEEELLSVSHITGVTPRSQKNITMFMASSYAGHKVCQPGDLAVNTMWVWMGALGIAKQIGLVSPSYSVYRLLSSDAFVSDFLDNLLRTKPYISEYLLRSTGIRSSRLRVYPEEFLKIRLIRPPYEEQERIVEAIAQKTYHIDRAIAQTQREIDLIHEYRTRLIADVVTGKLDVRHAAANLPEEAEVAEDWDETEEVDEDETIVYDDEEEEA